MVGQRRRKQELLGNHQSSWVWGRNVVLELLASSRWLPVELLVADDLEQSLQESVEARTRELGISLERTSRARLTELCKAADHQGLVAKLPAFPYASIESLISVSKTDRRLVLLDGIQDPFNLGAICRSAVVFGVDGIVLGEKSQVAINSQVVRSAVGAIIRLDIARSRNLVQTICELNASSVHTIATSLDADIELPDADLSGSIAIVIGNEGEGVRREVAAACTTRVRIPQLGEFDSLNAVVATGIVLYEIARQNRQVGTS